MSAIALIIGLAIGLLVGGGAAALIAQRSRSELTQLRQAGVEASTAALAREAELKAELAAAKAATVTDEQMLAAFKAASSDAMARQSQQLLHLAEEKYRSLQAGTSSAVEKHGADVNEGLKELAKRLERLETERARSVTELRTMVESLGRVTAMTKDEAARLASALSDNRVRGLWGEMQLRRALELAGLDRHVDFVEQRGMTNDSSSGRPDAVVAIPNGRCVVIDSKVPITRYLEALDQSDPKLQQALMVEHAKAVAGHVKALAGRDYAGLVTGAVDMVLLFLPGEPFLSAALDADPTLFESAAVKGIALVTPSSLIPILRGIALGWRERQAEEAAAEIHQLGVELHERIANFAERYARVGTQLGKTVEAFNSSVGSLDSRVLSTARRLSERGARSTKSLPEVVEVERTPRKLKSLVVGEPDPLAELS